MNIILLSAGRGSRMGDLTNNVPKCLLPVKGKSVLGIQLDTLIEVQKILKTKFNISIITGYLSYQIENYVLDFPELNIKTFHNPFYSVSDNYMSLWVGRGALTKPTIIINGDDLFTKEVIINLINNDKSFVSVTSTKEKYDSDDMKIKRRESHITIIDKSIPNPDGENAGIIKLMAVEALALKESLERNGKDSQYLKYYWLQGINDLIKQGHDLFYMDVDRADWAEIDFHPDIKNLQSNWEI